MEDHVLACDGPVAGLGVDLDTFDGGAFAAGYGDYDVADLDAAGVEAAGDGEGVLNAAAEDVVDG